MTEDRDQDEDERTQYGGTEDEQPTTDIDDEADDGRDADE